MMVIGSTENVMEKVYSKTTNNTIMRGTLKKEKLMEVQYVNIHQVKDMKGNGKKGLDKVRVVIFGKMENLFREILEKIFKKDLGYTITQMEMFMRESILKTKKMVMEHLFLPLEADTRENLKMVIFMEKEFITTVQEMFLRENGKMM